MFLTVSLVSWIGDFDSQSPLLIVSLASWRYCLPQGVLLVSAPPQVSSQREGNFGPGVVEWVFSWFLLVWSGQAGVVRGVGVVSYEGRDGVVGIRPLGLGWT